MSGWTLGAGLKLRHYLMLALAALAMFLPGQSRLPPVDRDESRYAQATTQMLETHDFVDVRYQDYARYLQPAGIYWLQSASVSLLSTPEARAIWAYRVPSVLAATAAVLLTAWVGSMMFGPAAGLAAALLMAASVLLGFESRMAKIDASLLATILTAQATLARIYLNRAREMSRPRLTASVFWAALGVGLMLKGPIILIVSGTTILVVCASERRWAWLKRLHAGWGVLVTLAIALPWLVAIGIISHGAFFEKAVGHNLLGKVGAGEQAHGQPPGYYLALFNLTFWPGSLAAVMALPFIWRERRSDQVRFLLGWIVPTWILFEAVATKLPHYVLPLYPAIAVLAAGAAVAGWGRGRWRLAGVVYAVLWLAVGLALALAGPLLLRNMQHVIDPLACAAAGLAVLLVLATAALLATGRRRQALTAAVLASFVVTANTYHETLPQLTSVWLSPRVAATARRIRPCPTTVFASSAFSEPSLVFLSGTWTKLVAPAGAADFVAGDRACRLALVDARQRDAFFARADADGFTPRPLAEVDGRNYSTGKDLHLTFYRADPAPAGRPSAQTRVPSP